MLDESTSFPVRRRLVVLAIVLLPFVFVPIIAAEEPLQFNRDIRPILAEKCLHCHGPDENARQADLRLDVEAQAKDERDQGPAIAPGDHSASVLWQRITSTDDAQRMPPADQPRQLTRAEVEMLERWIAEGAPYQKHWSLMPLQRPPVPPVTDSEWIRNPIDAFVAARIEERGWRPAPEADRATLLRRVSLDLIGLPPTRAEIDAFVADPSPDAYERVVDRLLASPQYGERVALMWLDVARFADSGGYQGDILRSMWPWRDWLIQALNQNMPFDDFTRWQLAGDLFPDATQSQRLATGFHRNHRINDEDGIIHEEFRVEYVADRVETTAAVWMGLTLGCARCHDHKYDPLSQRDYYRLYGFFNSIDESGRGNGNAPPLLHLPTPEQQQALESLDQQIAAVQNELASGSAAGASDPATNDTSHEQRLAELQRQRSSLLSTMNNVMVLQELPVRRETFVLFRGAYDQPREKVEPGVPADFGPPLPVDQPLNRLTLANWLLDPQHPLTARVTVNRFWQLHFGQGLVRTPEDFGTRGEPATHPELLDWLAVEFRDHLRWDVKRLQRLIVTSATYRQTSSTDEEKYRRDPDNRWLARGSRFRLPAELLRDQALAASGILESKIGGPSVRPYQPDGLWKDLASAHLDYEQGKGADLYRRSIYTFLRRTVPPPSMTALDMPNRELCTLRRPRTNTPLQALVLMNDPTFVEAARLLAEDVIAAGERSASERIQMVFRRVLGRAADEDELKTLTEAWSFYLERFQQSPERAAVYLTVGDRESHATLPAAEVAALAAVASIVMNTDEAVTRE